MAKKTCLLSVGWLSIAIALSVISFSSGDSAIIGGWLFLLWTMPFGVLWWFYLYDAALALGPTPVVQIVGTTVVILLSYCMWFVFFPLIRSKLIFVSSFQAKRVRPKIGPCSWMTTTWPPLPHSPHQPAPAQLKKMIAERRLFYAPKGSSVRKELIIRIGTPYLNEEGIAKCPVDWGGLLDSYSDIAGMDLLQALHLATDIDSMLKKLRSKYDFFWSSGEAYFDD